MGPETPSDPPWQPERRRHRLVIPPCARCGETDALRVPLRTLFVIYVRCEMCGFVWNEAKPGQGQPSMR
ncbi:MAG TPA: hypothetical protein VMO26_27050 [Vicinamibacterales bacterium]|nr:hypothetical protein [Vicinamibacterales bacterium]